MNPTYAPGTIAIDTVDRRATRLLSLLAATVSVAVALPIRTGGYGIFIDEFYYIACAKRLAWGFVDHPPLAPAILRLSRSVLGDSLLSLRLPPALAMGATVLITGLLAHRLGGGLYARLTAALCCASAPVFLIPAGSFSMNPFDMLLWACAFLILVEVERQKEPRLWLAFGALSGIALMNKHTFILLVLGLMAGVASTRARAYLKGRWPWLGMALAGLFVAPNLGWQVAYGWPSLEFYHNAYLYKNISTPPLRALLEQVFAANPVTFPVWAAGLYFLLRSPQGKPFRHLGWIYPVLFMLMVISQTSRPDRIAYCFALLFAAGAVQLEGALQQGRWARRALPAMIAAGAVALAPVSIPILPIEVAGRYATALGVPRIEKGYTAVAPLWFSNRLGWRAFVNDVRVVVASLGEPVRRRTAVVGSNYGYAGAVEYYAPDLSPAFAPHNTYYLWGPPAASTRVFVLIGFSRDQLDAVFADVKLGRVSRRDGCFHPGRTIPIWIAWGPRFAFEDIWRRAKVYR